MQESPVDVVVTLFDIPRALGQRMTGMLFRDITTEREVERRRDEFVSVASHELRTPMSTIMGFSELLLTRSRLDEEQRQWVEHIHRDSQRLATIVDDLLNVSRIESGKLSSMPSEFSLREVVDSVVTALELTTDRHQFRTAVGPETEYIIADRDKVVQVLTNLVGNAIKYSPAGGLVQVSVRAETDGKSITVSVSDQGIGIAKDEVDRLFTAFSRIKRPETEGIRGTGLGLYIVKGLIEFMGGKVWLESAAGKGSTFCFTLPLQPVEAGEVPATGGRYGR